jgi:hypothetical protein
MVAINQYFKYAFKLDIAMSMPAVAKLEEMHENRHAANRQD